MMWWGKPVKKWEYRVVLVDESTWQWADDTGRVEKLTRPQSPKNTHHTKHFSPILAALGEEGWEMTGVETYTLGKSRLYFKRPKS